MTKKAPYVESPEITERRRAALELMVERAGGVTRVATASGINRVHLEKLLTRAGDEDSKNRRSILSMRNETITRLLTAVNVSDSIAIRELLIPPHLQKHWLTMRPEPMGQKKRDRTGLLDVVLTTPLTVTLQPGHVMTVDQGNVLSGDVLVRVNGRFLVTPADAVPANAELLGQFVGADTSVRRPVPPL